MLLSRTLPLGVPVALALLASPAGAAPTAALTLSPSKPAGAATTCLSLTLGALDAVGTTATDTPTAVVSLSGTSSTSFCDPATGATLGPSGPSASRTVTSGTRFGVSSAVPGPVTVVAATGTVRSATATATFSDPPPPDCGPAPGLTVSPPRVVAGQVATATVTAAPGTEVQLYAYSRPSTTYRLARQVVVPASGSVDLPFRAPGSTRLYAVQRYCTETSPSGLLQVASPVSLAARRLSPLRFRFSGSTGGAPAGTPVALVHRTPSGDVVLARTVTDAAGRWTLDRRFSASARLPLLARTTSTAARLSGSSPVRPTAVS